MFSDVDEQTEGKIWLRGWVAVGCGKKNTDAFLVMRNVRNKSDIISSWRNNIPAVVGVVWVGVIWSEIVNGPGGSEPNWFDCAAASVVGECEWVGESEGIESSENPKVLKYPS